MSSNIYKVRPISDVEHLYVLLPGKHEMFIQHWFNVSFSLCGQSSVVDRLTSRDRQKGVIKYNWLYIDQSLAARWQSRDYSCEFANHLSAGRQSVIFLNLFLYSHYHNIMWLHYCVNLSSVYREKTYFV